MLTWRRWELPILLLVAGLTLWLLLAGPVRLAGVQSGYLGMLLLVAAALAVLYRISRVPRGDAEGISPGEWRAWIGLVFMAQLILYVLVKSDVFTGADLLSNPEARAVGRNGVILLIAWILVSAAIRARWKDEIQEDERDREIAAYSGAWGRGALSAVILGVAVMLGISPAEQLAWVTPLTVTNLLIFALLWGSLVEHATSAIRYWRDRA